MKKLTCVVVLPLFIALSQSALFAQTTEVLIDQANAAIEKTDYVSAMRSLNIIFKRSPNDETALTLRARIYVRQSKHAEGLADVTKVLAKNPKNHDALNIRGVIKRERDKDFEGALADFTKAIEIKPDFYLAIINIGVTNRSLRKPNDAMKAFNKAVELDPKNPIGFANRASTFIWIGKFKEAIPEYDKAISLNDKNDGYFSSRAYCHLRSYIDGSKPSGDLAKSDAEKSILLNPSNTLALGVRGIFKFVDRDNAGASSDADKALQLNANSFLSYMIRGLISSRTKKTDGTFDHDSAFVEFEKALKLAPNDSWVKSLWEEASRNSPAAKTKAVEVGKQKVAANLWDFTAYDELKDAFVRASSNESRAYWEGLIANNPKNICAIRFLGEHKGGNFYMDMVNFLNDGLRLYDGKNGAECAAEIAFRIGREYSDRRRFDDAREYFNKAKSIKSGLKYLDQHIANNESVLSDQRRVNTNDSEETRVNGLKDYYKRAFEKLGISLVKEGTAANTSARYSQLTVDATLDAGYIYHFIAICTEKLLVSGDGDEYKEYFGSGSHGTSSVPQKYGLASYFYTAAYQGKSSSGAFTFKPTREKVYWILFRSKRDSQVTSELLDDEDLKRIQVAERDERLKYTAAGLTPQQVEFLKKMDADEKKVNEASNALMPAWKRRLELEQSFSKLNDKLQSDSKNRLTYALQMKKDAEEVVRICEQFLSKYGTELGQTDLPDLNAKVDVINQQIREMRNDIVANKKNIDRLDEIIKGNSQP